MNKILRMTDRVKLTISGVEFYIAPLSVHQKHEIQSCTYTKGDKEFYDLVKAQSLYIKYALKDIKGLEDYNGEEYKLEFDGDALSDNCVNEIFNMDLRSDLNTAAFQLINGLKELEDPITGEKLEGVEMEVVPSLGKSLQSEQQQAT